MESSKGIGATGERHSTTARWTEEVTYRHWGTYTVTGGQIWADGALRHVRATTAVVADREHTQGGPLFVHLGHRTGGYVMGMRGWIHY